MEENDKLNTLMTRPDTMTRICTHIASGGMLIDLCEAWAVPYGQMLEWIHSDDNRNKLYQRSMQSLMFWAMDTVLKELKHIGTVDLALAYKDDGSLKHPKEMPVEVRRCIAGIEVMEEFEGVGKDRELIGYTKKVKFHDKIKALELIGKKFAMWIDHSKIDVTNKSIEELVDASINDEPIPVKNLAEPEPSTPPPTPGESGGLPREEGPPSL